MNRLFLALKVQLNDYNTLQTDFSEMLQGRWVEQKNLHITIAYFGNKYTIEELLEKLPSLITPIEPFTLSGLEYFESNKILYAASHTSQLDALYTSIAKTFSLGQTKPFIPHATLMRIKQIKETEAFKKALDNYKDKEIGSADTTFQLMQSHIKHPGGANYECLKKFEV